MPLVKDVGTLYRHALKNRYILGAFNMFNMESMKAMVEAAEEERSPIICQIGPWTRPYLGPLDVFVRYFKDYVKDSSIPIILHHDHCPTIQACKEAIDAGMQAVMFDGSSLPYEENVAKTCEVVAYAHAAGVWVESELGAIPGFEHEVFGAANSVHTEPDMAKRFVEETGTDSLAIAVGTAHGGVKADAPLALNVPTLKLIKEAIGDIPLVLHGAASLPFELIDEVNKYGGTVEYLRMVPEEGISASREYGVAKTNIDVDQWLCMTAAIRRFLLENTTSYSPTPYLTVGKNAFRDEIRHKMREVTKSAGMADSFVEE